MVWWFVAVGSRFGGCWVGKSWSVPGEGGRGTGGVTLGYRNREGREVVCGEVDNVGQPWRGGKPRAQRGWECIVDCLLEGKRMEQPVAHELKEEERDGGLIWG